MWVVGFAIIQVDSAPIALRLINTTISTVYYSTLVSIKANLVFGEIEEVTGATGVTGVTGDVIILRNNSAIPLTNDLAPSIGAQVTIIRLD